MDESMLIAEFENSHYTPTTIWQDSVDVACEKACQAIAPSWPLDQAIAVNPYWQRINRPLSEVAARMAVLGNISVFPARSYVANAWLAGRINPSDLNYALRNLRADQAAFITKDDCIKALHNKLKLPQLPLLIDVLDDDPKQHTRLSWREAITYQVSQTCAAYFDTYQADWQPDRKEGLYAFWRETLTHDHGISILMGLPDLGKQLDDLPATASDAENWVLKRLGLPESAWADYLEAVLLTVNGWASWCAYLRWQAALTGKTDPHLRELLAIRLAWGVILMQCKDDKSTRHALALLQCKWTHAADTLKQAENLLLADEIWQLALEAGYQYQLAESLEKKDIATQDHDLPEVQAVFCIDVRSEPLRRSLEKVYSRIQTIGFAGFFGLPVAYSPLGTKITRPQLPGLLAPSIEVGDIVCQAGCDEISVSLQTKAVSDARQNQLRRSAQWEAGSRWPSAAFTFVEAAGLSYLGKLKQWINPSQKSIQNNDQAGIPRRYRAGVRPMLVASMERKVDVASQVLNALGLKENIAPLVLFVGHGSQSDNNAHSATLDCGACCGQTGEVNARVLASILNDTAVRESLRNKEIYIPDETVFIAALHNTTTDEIEAFDLDLLSPEKLAKWDKIYKAFVSAGDLVRRERAVSLGMGSFVEDKVLLKHIRQRANDGAQTRPEWGLVGNAAFIISSRERTKHLLLNGRCFLHDYDAAKDLEGNLLELLMTAPMLVTHWINWQYHASTCDPLHMGCGNKVLHNVVGGNIGVFEGNGGDLRVGLSKQSVHDGEQMVHEPLRLTVVIDASAASIERVINKHAMVKQLVENGWLHLWRYDGPTLLRYSHGQWHDLGFVYEQDL